MAEATAPRASVVIPVKDGASHLPPLLAALQAQEVEGGLEIVATDSGSTDGSGDLLRAAGARVLPIAPAEFDHGETRNRGAREARGRYVVFLTQDAVPADAHFVRRLVDALEAEPRLAGAFARQMPRPEADPLTRRDLAAWIASGAEPLCTFVPDVAAFEALPPSDRYRLSVFDNVASAVRRETLLAHPFARTRFGEDVEWGRRMLQAGFGLAFVPAAAVVHSHPRSARALYRRNYLGHRLLRRLFGLHAIPDARHLIRAVVGTVIGDSVVLARARSPLSARLAAPAQAVAAVYGQYRGARDEVLGRPYPEWRS
jgi:rhamnosyltransferase